MASFVRKSKCQRLDANVVCNSLQGRSAAMVLSSTPAGERSK